MMALPVPRRLRRDANGHFTATLAAEMSVREKGLWAQALKALDDARLNGEIKLGSGVRIDVGCCDEMLHAAVAAGCRYEEDEVLAYTAAVASTLALQPQSETQWGLEWAG
jgi:hypothetical protein